jgi:predicted  nucleic acid-binding Zn-ribbon protein
MAWVYIVIAIGAAGFLVWIVIEYLNAAASLKPKADIARREIKEVEMKIESEQVAAEASKQDVEELKKEVAGMEKELQAAEKAIGQLQENERRRNPTKFRVED